MVMNLMIASDPAAIFARWLYQDACIALARKRVVALEVAAWERPASMRARSTPKRWTAEEDAIVLQASQGEAALLLGRTVRSVNLRRWRLRQAASACEGPEGDHAAA